MNSAIFEQADQHFLLLNHHGHRRRQQVGAIPADDDVDLVEVEQLLVQGGDGRRIALIVVVDEVDRAALDVAAPTCRWEAASPTKRAAPSNVANSAPGRPVGSITRVSASLKP